MSGTRRDGWGGPAVLDRMKTSFRIFITVRTR